LWSKQSLFQVHYVSIMCNCIPFANFSASVCLSCDSCMHFLFSYCMAVYTVDAFWHINICSLLLVISFMIIIHMQQHLFRLIIYVIACHTTTKLPLLQCVLLSSWVFCKLFLYDTTKYVTTNSHHMLWIYLTPHLIHSIRQGVLCIPWNILNTVHIIYD
jgi:hypothetical protein